MHGSLPAPSGQLPAFEEFEGAATDCREELTLETGSYVFATVDRLIASILTGAPSASSRTEANGPTITWSPGLSPDSTSKYFSPAIPVLTGMNSALFSRTTNTPSSSLRDWPGFSSEASTPVERRGRLSSVLGSRTMLPSLSTTTSRTVVA